MKLMIRIAWGTSKDGERSLRTNQKAYITRNLNGIVVMSDYAREKMQNM